MSTLMEMLRDLTLGSRIAVIVAVTAVAHVLVLLVRRLGTWFLAPESTETSFPLRRSTDSV